MRICWAKGISGQIRGSGWLIDYKGVNGDAEVEMNYIESQLNHFIMGLNLPTEDQILAKEYQFYEPDIPRLFIKIPDDPIARYQIDKVAKQVSREGYSFEDELKRIILKKKRFESDALYKVFR